MEDNQFTATPQGVLHFLRQQVAWLERVSTDVTVYDGECSWTEPQTTGNLGTFWVSLAISDHLPRVRAVAQQHGLPIDIDRIRRAKDSAGVFERSVSGLLEILNEEIATLEAFLEFPPAIQWSMYRTPKEWRGLRKAKEQAASEGTWLALRKKLPNDIHGEPGNEGMSVE
jgi:hypothetical protein